MLSMLKLLKSHPTAELWYMIANKLNFLNLLCPDQNPRLLRVNLNEIINLMSQIISILQLEVGKMVKSNSLKMLKMQETYLLMIQGFYHRPNLKKHQISKMRLNNINLNKSIAEL